MIKRFYLFIWNFIKFVVLDLVDDIKLLIEIFQGKHKNKKYRLEAFINEWKRPGFFLDMIKENYIFYLVVILAFCSGHFVSSQDCQDTCNTFILDTFYTEDSCLMSEQNKLKQFYGHGLPNITIEIDDFNHTIS